MLPILFAPLQGYTEDAYRRFHYEMIGGVMEYYTPFLRLEHGEVRSKDIRDVRPENNVGVPVVPQLIVSCAEEMNRLLDVVLEFGYSRVDINMGCPFPLQTKHGRGAGILVDLDKVMEICRVIENTPEILFSAKMRLGLDNNDDWKSVVSILNDVPLRHITLHPRNAKQQYKGDVDMNSFSSFCSLSSHPVVYNGDVTCLEDVFSIEKQFPQLAGIMIGRGLLARPTLALEYISGRTFTDVEVVSRICQLHDQLLIHYQKIIPGEQQQMLKLHTFWDFMEPTLGRKQWKKIVKAGNMKNYLAAVDELKKSY